MYSNQVMDLQLLHKERLHKDMVLLTKVTHLSNSQVMDHPNSKEVTDLLNNSQVMELPNSKEVMDLPNKVTHHLNSNQDMALLSNNQATRHCRVSTSMMVHHPNNNRGMEVHLTSSRFSLLLQVSKRVMVACNTQLSWWMEVVINE